MQDDSDGVAGRAGRPVLYPAINRFAAEPVAAMRVAGVHGAADWAAATAVWRVLVPGARGLEAEPVPPTRAAAVERVALALAAFLGIPEPPLIRTAVADADPGLVLIPAVLPAQSGPILELAAAIVGASANDADALAAVRGRFQAVQRAAALVLRGSRRPIIAAAVARGLPWRFVSTVGDLIQVGEGRAGVRLSASGSRRTGEIAVSIASNKHLANAVLQRAGVPVARQRVVETADEVRRFGAEAGYPLVLKPVAMRRQEGVRFVYRPDQAAAAIDQAGINRQLVVAESYLPGPEHRVLVVDGEILAAFERSAPTVTGDGRRTIADLVAAANSDPLRGDWRAGFELSPIVLDAVGLDFLASRGWRPDSVPPEGAVVECHPLPFVGYGGGRRVDSTDRIHPDNRAVAVRALAALELDAGGIDFRCPDISRSWREVGAGICEVNPRPDLGAHYLPGLDRDVGGLFLDRRGPAGGGHMPQVLLVGDGRPERRARRIAEAVRRAFGWRVAAGWPGGGDLGGLDCDPGGDTLPAVASAFIENPTLDAAVYATTPRRLLAEGVGSGRLDLVLTDRGPGRDWPEALAALRATAAPIAPLPADDAVAVARVIAAMAPYRAGGRG